MLDISVRKIEADKLTGAVHAVWVNASKTLDDGSVRSFEYGVSFDTDPSDNSFIPLQDLTEIDVIGWVNACSSDALNAQYERLFPEPEKTQLPWV